MTISNCKNQEKSTEMILICLIIGRYYVCTVIGERKAEGRRQKAGGMVFVQKLKIWRLYGRKDIYKTKRK